MSTLSDLVHAHTSLDVADVDHLHRLAADWQLLSDLSFADLLLWVRGRDGQLVCVAQVRPTTGPTTYQEDQVGAVEDPSRHRQLVTALDERRIVREGDPEWQGSVPVRREAIPVRRGEAVIAVLGRDTNLSPARVPSQLELAYLQTAAELAAMVAEGTFPLPTESEDAPTGPRAGDGLLRLDPDGRVVYASPNALSAYRRLGITGNILGTALAPLSAELVASRGAGADAAAHVQAQVVAALAYPSGHGRAPDRVEVEADGAVVLLRLLPLQVGGRGLGALVLVRDMTELRHRDRQLLSKDATIREIHHRVKNNLQTVAALLRLQARRVQSPQARVALEESVRRVSSIAVVHETLSASLDESVEFDVIVDRVISMVAEVAAPETLVTLCRTGSFGVLPAQVATPLVMVLTELMQNAVEHAFPEGGSGSVVVSAERRDHSLLVTVRDDGAGLPPGFRVETSNRLGLQIVRTLVGTELGGRLSVAGQAGGGTSVALEVPLR